MYASVFSSRNPTRDDVIGVASLIFWTLTLIVLLKYVLIVLFADDNGEGEAGASVVSIATACLQLLIIIAHRVNCR